MESLLLLSSALLMSQRRHVWVLFPAFILLARWGKGPWLDSVIVLVSLLGLGLFTAIFANWYWLADRRTTHYPALILLVLIVLLIRHLGLAPQIYKGNQSQ